MSSWIDLELSAVFGNCTLPESGPTISGLSESDEAAIVADLQRIERIVAERRAAIVAQDAAKARAFKAMRRRRMVSA